MMVFEILTSLLPLAIVVGIVVLIVRSVSTRDRSATQGAGVAIRRFFVYTFMLVTLLLAGLGLAGIVDAIASAGSTVATASADIARSVAFVVVGLPVYAGLGYFTSRRLREDPAERRSFGWAFYLTVALIGSLIATLSLLIGFIGELLRDGDVNRSLVINGIIWGLVWTAHWWAATRWADKRRMAVHLLLGSAIGLITSLTAAGWALSTVLQELYGAVLATSIVDSGVESIAEPLVILAIAAPVWAWYWLRHARSAPRTPSWLAYVVLLGILGGVTAVVIGSGTALFGVLQWLLGDPGTVSAAAHFDFMPGAVAAIAVGAASWGYHGVVLGDRAERQRTEVDRVYDYVLSGSGLLVAAGGLATLITIAIDAIGGSDLVTGSRGDVVAVALTLLIIGIPLWWRYWSTIRSYRADDPGHELASVTRRIYLFLLFGATGLVALVNLVILIFILVEDILEGTLQGASLSTAAVPIAILLTAGAVAWYHFLVFREDREAAPDHPRDEVAVREVILVSRNGRELLEALAATTARVDTLHTAEMPRHMDSVEAVLEALDAETHSRVVVVETGEHQYDVVALDA